jgi:hypothetical protein
MIKQYNIENKDTTYLRIWQKVNFGKEFLEPGFIADRQIADIQDSHKLSVYQFDPNTRLFYLDDYLYWVTSDEAIYNYLDTGRAITLKGSGHYYEHNKNVIYIYNDMLIADKVIIGFEKYEDKESLSLKLLAETEFNKVYLIFNEDLDKIKQRLAELEAEKKQIELAGKQEESIKGDEEAERLVSLIRQYDKMTLLEDNDAIIKDNYFIDKDEGLKIEFKDKVVKLFDKDDLVTESRYYNLNGFIVMDYRHFLQILERIYSQGKYAEPIEEKLKNCNKKWLSFKIYSYDKETKAEAFLKEIKIENNVNDKGKLRYKINGIKMPIQKMSKVMEFIAGGHYNHSDTATKIDRITHLEDYLEKIRLYSGTQLELLEGKTIEIKLNGATIPLHFNII